MTKRFVFSCLILALCLLSCDPTRRIEMTNKSSDTAEVLWKSKDDSIGFNPFVLSNSRELRFVVPPRNNADVKLSFGMGTWSRAEVEKAIHRLDYLQITTPARKLKIEAVPDLLDYLLARRKGIDKSKIEIVIEN